MRGGDRLVGGLVSPDNLDQLHHRVLGRREEMHIHELRRIAAAFGEEAPQKSGAHR